MKEKWPLMQKNDRVGTLNTSSQDLTYKFGRNLNNIVLHKIAIVMIFKYFK